jgi:hypothetical protein
VQDHAADHLDVEVALAKCALAAFSNCGEGCLQNVVDGCPLVELAFEILSAFAQLRISQS